MTGDMSGSCRMAGSACGEPGGRVPGIPGSGVCGECGHTCFGHRQLPAGPCPPGFDGSTGPDVIRVPDLEKQEHLLGACGSLQRQCDVRLSVGSLG
jgi:hypothetical protein